MIRVFAAAFFFLTTGLYAGDIPQLAGRVNDYAGMITPEGKAALEAKLLEYEKSTSTQIVILTVNTLDGEPIEGYGIRVAEKWKIGQAKKDNGIIIIAARDDRQMRIEVGYGLEGAVTDLITGRIITQIMAPSLQAGNNDKAFSDAVDALILAAKGEFQGDGSAASSSGVKGKGKDSHSLMIFLLFAIFILGKVKRILGGFVGAAGIPLIVHMFIVPLGPIAFIAIIFLGFLAGLAIPSLGFLGYFFGGGGSSSGGGSFSGGGGSFGGGGASGRW